MKIKMKEEASQNQQKPQVINEENTINKHNTQTEQETLLRRKAGYVQHTSPNFSYPILILEVIVCSKMLIDNNA